MLCRSDDEMPVNWLFQQFSSTVTERICYNGEIVDEYIDKFSIDNNRTVKPLAYNLIIHNVNFTDAGEYTCVERAGLGPDKVSANLTVIEHDIGEHSLTMLLFLLSLCTVQKECSFVALSVEYRTCDQEVVGSILSWTQYHTYVPLSPSSISWYWPKGGDARWLSR